MLWPYEESIRAVAMKANRQSFTQIARALGNGRTRSGVAGHLRRISRGQTLIPPALQPPPQNGNIRPLILIEGWFTYG